MNFGMTSTSRRARPVGPEPGPLPGRKLIFTNADEPYAGCRGAWISEHCRASSMPPSFSLPNGMATALRPLRDRPRRAVMTEDMAQNLPAKRWETRMGDNGRNAASAHHPDLSTSPSASGRMA
jgi:hypothetical protein